MNILILNLLRFVHVVAGIFWGGAAISYLFFVKPSVSAIGVAGPQFMENLMKRRKYPIFMMSTSLLTVLAGGILFWFSSGGFNAAWMASGPCIGFTIGSDASLLAFLAGGLGAGPTSERMAALGGQIGAWILSKKALAKNYGWETLVGFSPSSSRYLFLLPWLTSVLALVLLVFAILAWKNHWWKRFGLLMFSLGTLATLSLTGILIYLKVISI